MGKSKAAPAYLWPELSASDSGLDAEHDGRYPVAEVLDRIPLAVVRLPTGRSVKPVLTIFEN